MGIWCNEAQERYVLIVAAEQVEDFEAICARERCPVSVIGTLTDDRELVVHDREFDNRPVEMPMDMLLGNPPKMTRDVSREPRRVDELDLAGIDLQEAVQRVLRFPAVADKSFLIHIGDRSVGGLSVRDQMVGPWQVPVSDVAITATGYTGYTGEAMAMGERTPLATLNAPASGRMAVAEAITNIAAARDRGSRQGPAVRQLDGGGRSPRRGRAAVRHGQGGRRRVLPRARRGDPGRQGLAVAAGALERGRARSTRWSRPCR